MVVDAWKKRGNNCSIKLEQIIWQVLLKKQKLWNGKQMFGRMAHAPLIHEGVNLSVQMGLNCIERIAWGVGILEILAIHHRFPHSCVHDLKEVRDPKYVDWPCCMMKRQINKTFLKICGIYTFQGLFSQMTNNFVSILKNVNKTGFLYKSVRLTYEKCLGIWRSFLLLLHAKQNLFWNIHKAWTENILKYPANHSNPPFFICRTLICRTVSKREILEWL